MNFSPIAAPRITVQPKSHVIRHNMLNVSVLKVAAAGIGDIYYLWEKYDSYSDSWISVSSRAVNDTSPMLNFNVITEEDQGIYHCIVTNYDGSVTSDNVTITVFGKLFQEALAIGNVMHSDVLGILLMNRYLCT